MIGPDEQMRRAQAEYDAQEPDDQPEDGVCSSCKVALPHGTMCAGCSRDIYGTDPGFFPDYED